MPTCYDDDDDDDDVFHGGYSSELYVGVVHEGIDEMFESHRREFKEKK